MTTPDVTVVVAVYNTMPYLLRCLESLLGQSIGHERLEVVAVDDGSTDDSAEVLDKYAASHPEVVRVIHQENSGGPAAPSNKALDVATGRYVYFLGADDYLGEEALERMVAFADEHGSDVVIGKMEGVNGRGVHQGLFEDGNQVDVDPYGPKLRWAMANTKLFRRDLVERLGLRYREDMPFGSDQPFTLAACVHAKRISVLADYTCYYAVQREDRSNISYKTPYEDRVENIHQMMRSVAELVPAGPRRDTILTRHFAWEVPRLLRQDLLESPEAAQRAVCAGVRRMAEEYLQDAMLEELPVSARLRVAAAAREDLALLSELVRDGEAKPDVVHLEDGHALAVLPGFRTSGLPDDLYRMAPVGVRGRLNALARPGEVRVDGDLLRVEVTLPVVGPDVPGAFTARVEGTSGEGQPQPAEAVTRPGHGTATTAISVDLARIAGAAAGPCRLRLAGEVMTGPYEVRVPGPEQPVVSRFWRRGRPHRVSVATTARGRDLEIRVHPLPVLEVAAAGLRRLRRA
jgi:glycosyltransferase involved in cell wall biosynthesis